MCTMGCGKYGICSNEQCSYPLPTGVQVIFFRPINYKEPDLGCAETSNHLSSSVHGHTVFSCSGQNCGWY